MAVTGGPAVSWRLEPGEDGEPDCISFWCTGRFAGRFEALAFLERAYGNQLTEGGFVLDGPAEAGGPVVVEDAAEAEIAAALRAFLGLAELARPGPRSRPSPLAEG